MTANASGLPIIRPITDMRTKFNEVCTQATEEQEPIIPMKNGTAAYLLYDVRAYEAQQQRNQMLAALHEAEIEKRHRPDSITKQESDQHMRDVFSRMGPEYA